MYEHYRAKCADCQIAYFRTSTTRKRCKKWRKLITCLHSPMSSIPLPSLFGHPAILASACFRSTLRFRPCGTGFAALSPADAGRSPRPARPALEDPRRSCRIVNGSLVEASFVFARPEVIGRLLLSVLSSTKKELTPKNICAKGDARKPMLRETTQVLPRRATCGHSGRASSTPGPPRTQRRLPREWGLPGGNTSRMAPGMISQIPAGPGNPPG